MLYSKIEVINIIVEKSYYVGHISTNFNQISTCQPAAYRMTATSPIIVLFIRKNDESC